MVPAVLLPKRGRRPQLAALIGGVFVLAAAGRADAFVVKKTTHGELVHWERSDVNYTIDPSVDANVAEATNAVRLAMGSWSGTVGAPELAPITPDAAAPRQPGFDEKNGIFFMKDGYKPAGRALAITVLTYDNASGRILDADVVFNGVYRFQVLPTHAKQLNAVGDVDTHVSNTDNVSHADEGSTANDAVYDLHHVIAHELGHSLGMNDELAQHSALMYRYSAPNDTTIRSPESDDIAGLAELYSTRLEAHGNGCGSATVSPKKPSTTSSRLAMLATLGLLLFLAFRAKKDRRARVVFVLAAAVGAVALLPNLSGKHGVASASATSLALGHARGKVLATSTSLSAGLFQTTYRVATTTCRTTSCPKTAQGTAWGGTIGNVTQEVGGYFAPAPNDDVDLSFADVANAFDPIAKPLAGRNVHGDEGAVRVITAAR